MSNEIINFNEKEVRQCYKFLNHLNETEIRLIDPTKKESPKSFFVKSENEFIDVCKKYNGKYNLYAGINERTEGGTKGENVISVKTIVIDIDAIREKGFEKQPATEEELKKSEEICDNIIKEIKKTKQPLPVKLCSGNGYQLWFAIPEIKIDDLNRKEIENKIQLFQDKIIALFDRNNAIDKIGDLPRIIKIWGSYNIKGMETDGRKYRVAKVVGEFSRMENDKLKEQIMNLSVEKTIDYEEHQLEEIDDIDFEKLPPCINHLIKFYENKDGNHWCRIVQLLSSFFMSIGLQKEKALVIILNWNKKQPYHEDNEEIEIKEINDRIYRNKINVPNCKKIKNEKSGFPYFGLSELKLCKSDNICKKCINPIIRYKREIENENQDYGGSLGMFSDKKETIRRFHDEQPFFYNKSKLWWFWNKIKKYWELVDETDLLNGISKSNPNIETINSKEKTELLEAMKQVGREKIPEKIKPSWIQFKNKIFDVETGEQFEATPKYFVTNPIPWNLHDSKEQLTPEMDRIFEEWVGKDYVKTLYEILAYCLIPDYPIHRLFCFIGEGMNGKSKFLELLRRFVGNENCCSTELDTLLQSRFEVTRLHKKLVCQMGETNFNEMSKTSILKKLSGGDLIGFEYKNKDPFEEKNYAKIIIATNNLPTTTDKTIGFYRRWLIVDFPNRFSEKKDILKEIPEEEYEMLAVKCCNILKDLLEKRAFHKEGTIEDRIEKYEAKSNFLEKFIELFTINNGSSYITKSDFYKKFIAWSKENRHRDMSEKSVGMAMKKLGFESEKKYFDWMYDGKGGQARVWSGLEWKD